METALVQALVKTFLINRVELKEFSTFGWQAHQEKFLINRVELKDSLQNIQTNQDISF